MNDQYISGYLNGYMEKGADLSLPPGAAKGAKIGGAAGAALGGGIGALKHHLTSDDKGRTLKKYLMSALSGAAIGGGVGAVGGGLAGREAVKKGNPARLRRIGDRRDISELIGEEGKAKLIETLKKFNILGSNTNNREL